jgi:phosphoribosylamine--glycine ligase
MRVLVVGGGAREHAIAYALRQAEATVVALAKNRNPGLQELAESFHPVDPGDSSRVVGVARETRVDYAVIGPEAPLIGGLADALRAANIPVVGPGRDGARLEGSKRYCRELLERHQVAASPRHYVLTPTDDAHTALGRFPQPFVIKPEQVTSGKGVWVQGADFTTLDQAEQYVGQLRHAAPAGAVLLEEKLEGEEFSLMAFVTDSGVYAMPAVQDYKRALDGDQGSNTGGMGSYSQRDQLLPFLSRAEYDRAVEILRQVVAALRTEGISYRGVLYGGFMLTVRGPLLLECNVRFGDPEGINALTLYEEGDLDEVFFGVAQGRVNPTLIEFRPRATVVKYVVPPGYGATPTPGGILELDTPAIEAAGVHVRYGSVESAGPGRVKLSTSRGVALVGEASAIWEASARVETALQYVRGTYYVRHDIGSRENLVARWEHMRRLLAPQAKPSPIPLSVLPPDAPPSSAADASQVIG